LGISNIVTMCVFLAVNALLIKQWKMFRTDS